MNRYRGVFHTFVTFVERHDSLSGGYGGRGHVPWAPEGGGDREVRYYFATRNMQTLCELCCSRDVIKAKLINHVHRKMHI